MATTPGNGVHSHHPLAAATMLPELVVMASPNPTPPGPRRVKGELEFIKKAMGRCGLLRDLTDDEVAEVATHMHLRWIPAGDDIFHAGEKCHALWVLLAGKVRLTHSAAAGRQQVVGFRGPVSTLDLAPALDGGTYTATATAMEDAYLAVLVRPMLALLSQRHPLTIRNSIDQLCLELRQRDIATAIAVLKDARGRIGCTLLQLARQFGEANDGNLRIALRLSRQDVADSAGVTLETAIRVLSEWQRKGAIRTRAQTIEILDLQAVRAPAACSECQFDCAVFTPRLRTP